jgi:hypothetical protein
VKQYLVVDVEVEVPNSADPDAQHPDLELYGHDTAAAEFKVRFELVPASSRNYETRLRGSRNIAPSVELEKCTAYWTDKSGNTYLQDYELTPEQYAMAVAVAMQEAKAVRFNVSVEKAG